MSTESDTFFSDRLRLAMRSQGISQTDLAKRCNTEPSWINHFTRNRRLPTFGMLARILDAMPDVDARWLITGES